MTIQLWAQWAATLIVIVAIARYAQTVRPQVIIAPRSLPRLDPQRPPANLPAAELRRRQFAEAVRARGGVIEEQPSNRALRAQRKDQIIEAIMSGRKYPDVAREFGLTPARVSQIATAHGIRRRVHLTAPTFDSITPEPQPPPQPEP